MLFCILSNPLAIIIDTEKIKYMSSFPFFKGSKKIKKRTTIKCNNIKSQFFLKTVLTESTLGDFSKMEINERELNINTTQLKLFSRKGLRVLKSSK